ncbi:hypothetical protein [Megasphaera sp.]|uniref:hypothetical protein n=1 Tax=Megasphaera sp. TaxID=2023260 RepID=UPI0040297540
MNVGLQVFDANGNLDVDTTTGIAKYLGKFTTGFSNGSFKAKELINRRLWLCNSAFSVDTKTYRHTLDGGGTGHAKMYFKEMDYPKIKFDYSSGTVYWEYIQPGVEKVQPGNTVIYDYSRISCEFIVGAV